MPWFKVDDGFHGHPKVVELSLAAVGIWTLGGSWCAKYLTDGAISAKAITRMGGDDAVAAELVSAGLWLPSDDGYDFKDWDHYQPLKADVEAERAAAQERMRVVRAKKKGVGSSDVRPNVQPNNSRSSEDVRVTPSQSHPIPVPLKDVAAKRGTRIPEPFIVTTAMRAWAAKEAPNTDVDRATTKFVNYWRARTRDATKKDWKGTWENWLMTDSDRSAAKPTPEQRARKTLTLATDLLEQKAIDE